MYCLDGCCQPGDSVIAPNSFLEVSKLTFTLIPSPPLLPERAVMACLSPHASLSFHRGCYWFLFFCPRLSINIYIYIYISSPAVLVDRSLSGLIENCLTERITLCFAILSL